MGMDGPDDVSARPGRGPPYRLGARRPLAGEEGVRVEA